MSGVDLPVGRVADTGYRDLARALLRAADPGPARPTKTIVPPSAGRVAARSTDTGGGRVRVAGPWSLAVDEAGRLVAEHDDGGAPVVLALPPNTDDEVDSDG